ncbi:MAG: hypothetical protein ACXACY_13385 [Candidatus Hodarchaeales archaeon]|jgi:hypothetical protein
MEHIKTSGKFEGCPTFVPYFWDRMLEGFASDEKYIDDVLVSTFRIIPDDRKLFPELKGFRYINLWEDGNGFVYYQLTCGKMVPKTGFKYS